MSINDELTAIEATVDECEKMIADGKINADALVRQIQSIVNPDTMIAKAGEVTSMLIGQSNKINIMRMKELKNKHPNDLRVSQLGRRAAQCFLTLMNVGLSVSEAFGSPDVRAAALSQNNKARKLLEIMVSDLASP